MEETISLYLIQKLMEAQEDDNELSIFLECYNENPENKEIILNFLTSFITGSFNPNHTDRFLLILKENEIEQIRMIEDWTDFLNKQHSEENNFGILNKILDRICAIEKMDQRCRLTKIIWKFKNFRKLLQKEIPKCANGVEYETKGIFRSVYDIKLFIVNNYVDLDIDVNHLIETFKPLIEDETIHKSLVQYFSHILKVNMTYTQENPNFVKDKTSMPQFVFFIMRMIFELINYYNLTNLVEFVISNQQVYELKDYMFKSDNIPIQHQLLQIAYYSILISHIYSIKNYLHYKREIEILGSNQLINLSPLFTITGIQEIIDRTKPIIKCLISRFTNDTNLMIQNLYLEYPKIAKFLKSDDICNDIILFVDYESQLDTKFHDDLSSNLYSIISRIMGGFIGSDLAITQNHVRYYAMDLILYLVPKLGFQSFGTIFDDMFSYLSEVDIFKLTDQIQAIKHQKNIVEVFTYLLDYTTILNQNRPRIVSGTLFNLLRRAIETLTYFKDFIAQSHMFTMIPNIRTFCVEMFELIIRTLVIYKEIYSKKIISEVIPEVENKYVTFISELISKLSKKDHEIYTIIQLPETAQDIIRLSYETIYLRVDEIPQYLYEIKDTILNNIECSMLGKNEKDQIISVLLSYQSEKIEYPPEFQCTLTLANITDPVMLPLMEDFFDKTSIVTQIYHDPIHPYTRDPLTIEILEEFNKRPEIIQKILDFNDRKNKWLESHNKSK